MKKLLLIFLLVLTGTTTSFAQHWEAPVAQDYEDRAPLLVQFYLGDQLANGNDYIELAAFINDNGDEVCRGDVIINPQNSNFGQVTTLSVYGNTDEDTGKTITFKAFYNRMEYALKVTDTWNIEMDSHPIPLTLTLDPLNAVNLPKVLNLQGTLPFTHNLMDDVSFLMGTQVVEKTETANSELLGPLYFAWDAGNASSYFSVNESGVLNAIAEGSDLYLGLTMTCGVESETAGPVTFNAYTTVNITAAEIPVTGIAVSPAEITASLGDNIWELMDLLEVQVIFTPETATNQEYSISWDDQEGMNEDGYFTAYGVYEVKIMSDYDNNIFTKLSVKVPEPIGITCPESIDVYTTRNVILTLTNPTGEGFDGSKISISFDEMDNFGPVATAVKADNTGLVWRVRGRVFGSSYLYYVMYDGEPIPVQQAVAPDGGDDNPVMDVVGGLINVHYEVEAAEGWDWISVYALPYDAETISLVNEGNGQYLNPLKNRLIEMRTQEKLLYKDPEKGFFGDLTALDPLEGMIKVKTNGLMRIDVGSDVMAENNYSYILEKGQQLKKGYNWITYNSCSDHTLGTEWFDGANEGDMIIGKDNFATYTGGAWLTSEQNPLVFKVGKGYIYFANGNNTHLNFNDLYEDDNGVKILSEAQDKFQDLTGLTVDNSLFADNMPIIASIPNLDNPADYVVCAFVDNECRGFGGLAKDGAMFVNVAGKMGEKINFRLVNINTGEIIDLNESIGYSMRAGTLASPVVLTGETTAIQGVQTNTTENVEIYDTAGRRVNQENRGVNIIKHADGKNVKILK